MSGHNKWSKIKHQKGLADAGRGQLFTKLANAITIAAKEGGGAEEQSNVRLRLAIEKAREANMPKENIERARNRATGSHGGVVPETIIYEGFAPAGVGILIEVLTDSKQRSAAEMKNVLSLHGGRLGGAGSAAYLFEKIGQITLAKNRSVDEIADIIMTSSALDFSEDEGEVAVVTNVSDLHVVFQSLQSGGLTINETQMVYRPITKVVISDPNTQKKITQLVTALHNLPDVQNVYINALFQPS